MIKRTFFLSLALVTGLATAMPNQPQDTQSVSIIQKLKNSCKSYVQKIKNSYKSFKEDEDAGLNFVIIWSSLLATTYLFDRSIVLGHEASHCIAGWMTLHFSHFYISPEFGGGGHYTYYSSKPISDPLERIFNTIISAAGPLGGVITTLAWLKVWNIFIQNKEFKNFKKRCTKGWEKPLFNKNSSLIATMIIFYTASKHYFLNMFPTEFIRDNTYGSLSGTASKSDGLHIQENLAEMCPALAKMYPSLVYAGLAGLAGYGAYGLYTMIKAKYKAYQENKSFVWY